MEQRKQSVTRHIKRGIGIRLTLIISAILLAAFAGTATYDAITNYTYHIQENSQRITLENKMHAAKLEQMFCQVYQTCCDLEGIVQTELTIPAEKRNREIVVANLKRLLERNNELRNLGVFFEPNAFDGKDKEYGGTSFYNADGRFIPYAERLQGDIKVISAPGINDSSKNSWYTRPMQEKQTVMIPPYEFEGSGAKTILTTMAMPILKEGKVLAIINADIDIGDLQDKVAALEGTSKENFKILCATIGTVVANGVNSDAVMENELKVHPEFKEYFDQVQQHKVVEHIAVSTTSGLRSKYIFVPIDIAGTDIHWILISVTAMGQFTAVAYRELIITIIQYICILIGIIIVLYAIVHRIVSIPLRKTSAALKDIAQGEGDLTVRLPVKGNDEITDLSQYFNQTIEKIGKSIKSVGSNTQIMTGIGSELSTNMSETASSIHQISANIDGVKQQAMTQAASVTETAATIEEIIRTIKQLNKSIETQAASVSQSSSSIEEMVANIASITQTLEKSDGVIKTLAGATADGKDTITGANSITQKIAEESGGLLEASSVIQHIASQTNLLAMNAAIEAAHAGDAGKGFAVVADEIRKLAEESSLQGKTITSTLKTLSGEIERLFSSSKIVEEKFNAIFKLAEQVKDMSHRIMEAMKEQENGSREVLSAIRSINEVTVEVQAGSEEMLRGGEGVAEEMQKLDGLTRVITDSMNEMAAGAIQINNAVQEVNAITQKNKESIEALAAEVGKFKV